MLNEDLELTPQAEIRQLKRVIAEKDRTIKDFKEYDEKRTKDYNRMVENYNIMQEQFERFCDDVRDFEDIDNHTANDFIKQFYLYYQKIRIVDQLNNIFNDLKNKVNALDKAFGKMKSEVGGLSKTADKIQGEIDKFKDFIETRQSEWKK